MSLSYLIDRLNLDENLPRAYVIGRGMDEGPIDRQIIIKVKREG